MRADKERDPCSKADELLLHRLLARHGFDPDRRPHVCELAGVLVGGHELDSSETRGRCSQGVPGSSRSGRGRDRGGIEPAGQATYFNFAAVHVPRADRGRDRSRPLCPTGCAGRYCRTARSPAGRRHPRTGARGPSTPTANARATRALSARPATVTLSWISAQPSAHPPSPAAPSPEITGAARPDVRECTLDSAAHVKPEPATGAARPWPSVESRRCAPTVPGAGRRPLTCIAAVTASGSAMTVSATALRVQEFDKGRGPVGLPPIGQACDLPAWPDQGPREGSLVKFWSGHQPDADAHRERGHSARRAWLVTPLTRPPESGPWTAGSKGANRGGDRRIRGADTGLSCRGPG